MKKIKSMIMGMLMVINVFIAVSCKEEPVDVVDTSCVFEATLTEGDTDNPPVLTVERTKGTKEGSFTMEYSIDQDASLNLLVNGSAQSSPYSFTLDAFGVLKFQLPCLAEGQHTLKLVISNKYNESTTKELKFTIAKVIVPVKDITFVETLVLQKGATSDIPVTFVPDNATDKALYAVSSDEKVVTVEAVDGKLFFRALDGGSAVITVQADKGNITKEMAVTVVDPADISVSPYEAYVPNGGEFRFAVKVEGAFVASVSDDSLAKVSETGEDYVIVKNVSGSFYDEKSTLSVINSREGGKKVTVGLTLQAKEEVVEMNVTSQDAGVTVITVGNGCGRFDVASLPNGLTQVVNDRRITLTNNSYKDISGSLKIVTSAQKKEKSIDIIVKGAAAILNNIVLSPENASVYMGKSQKFTAKGVYTDGSQKDLTDAVLWFGDEYVSHDGSLFVGVKEGVATVSASLGSVTGKTKLTVKRNAVKKLTVTPETFDVNIGESVTFKVKADYEDGSSRDVTQELVSGNWGSSGNVVLSGNVMTARSEGAAWVKVSLDSKTVKIDGNVKTPAVTSLVLSPANVAMKVGDTQDYKVNALRSDGSNIDVTSQVTWDCSSNLVRNGSMFTAGKAGEAWIKASYSGKSVTAKGMIAENITRDLSTVVITPATFALEEGDNIGFSAKAFFDDGSEEVLNLTNATWSGSSNMIRGEGMMYKAVRAGEAWVNVEYTFYGTKKSAKSSGTVAVKDTPATLTGVSIDPKSVEVKPGEVFSFTGTDLWSDGTKTHKGEFSVTGPVSGERGNYTAVEKGKAVVTYSFEGFSAKADVTILPPDDVLLSTDKGVKFNEKKQEQYVPATPKTGNRGHWVKVNGKAGDSQEVGPEGGSVVALFTAGHTVFEQKMKQHQIRYEYYLHDVQHWSLSGDKYVNETGPHYTEWQNEGEPVNDGAESTIAASDDPEVTSSASWLGVDGKVQASAGTARTGTLVGRNGDASASLAVSQYVLSDIELIPDVEAGKKVYYEEEATIMVNAVYSNGKKADVTSKCAFSKNVTSYELNANVLKHTYKGQWEDSEVEVSASYSEGGVKKSKTVTVGMGKRYFSRIVICDGYTGASIKPAFEAYYNDGSEVVRMSNGKCDYWTVKGDRKEKGHEANAEDYKGQVDIVVYFTTPYRETTRTLDALKQVQCDGKKFY